MLICKAVIIRDEQIMVISSWDAALENKLGMVEDLLCAGGNSPL